MTTDLALRKSELRQELRARVKTISAEQRQEAVLRACDLLRQQRIWREARSVLFYAPLKSEMDLLPLLDEALAARKTVALPSFIAETSTYGAFEIRNLRLDCAPGKFGILEPQKKCPAVALKRLDLVLVPGVGFDLAGHRLGRGQGFYDRLLAQVPGSKCGIAFDEQVIARVPAEPHDVRLNCILTPTRWFVTAP